MTGEIIVESSYLVHDGGTKFYEVVTFMNADAKKCAVVKRWGKMSTTFGGGEILIEEFASPRAAQSAAEKIVSGKKKRGYNPSSSMHGFNGVSNTYKDTGDFIGAVGKHYHTELARKAILRAMFIEDADDTRVWVDETAEIVSEEPAPEPDRDDTYGSW